MFDPQRRLEQSNIHEQNLKKRMILSDLRRQVTEKQEQLHRFEESLASGSNSIPDPPVHVTVMFNCRLIAIMNLKNSVLAKQLAPITFVTKDLKKMFSGQSNFSPLGAIFKDLQ